jgi:hypothetical protein
MLGRALRALADAIELLGELDGSAAAELRAAAGSIEGSPSSSGSSASSPAEAVEAGLRSVLQTLLVKKSPAGQEQGYHRTISALRRAVDRVRPELPVREQAASLGAALRAATDAVLIARAAEPAFGAGEAEALSPPAVGPIADELEQAREDVLALGATRWTGARRAAARALSSLADVIESADRSRAQRAKVSEGRFQAERLRSTDALVFGQAGWAKAGLRAALDALDALGIGGERFIADWTEPARQAVAGINEGDGFTFQRAAVQDGFRATLDAAVAAAEVAGRARRGGASSHRSGAHAQVGQAAPVEGVGKGAVSQVGR